jgi:hypothetical protein
LFSLIFIIAGSGVSLLLLLPYKYANVTEVRALIPDIVVGTDTAASINSNMSSTQLNLLSIHANQVLLMLA